MPGSRCRELGVDGRSGMTAGNGIWRVVAGVRGPGAGGSGFSLLDGVADAVSAFESVPEEWRIEAYPRSQRSLTVEFEAQLALAAAGAGGTVVELSQEKLSSRDWLAENQLAF